jgi:hypothetical protein
MSGKVDKEIDLVQVVLDLIQLVKSNMLVLFISLLFGFGLGGYIYFVQPSSKQVIMQNKLILDSKVVSNEIVSAVLNVVNQENEEGKMLKMNLTKKEVGQILSVDSKIVSYTLKTNDSTLNSMIEVDLKYDSQLSVKRLLSGLDTYLKTNNYLIKKQKHKLLEAQNEIKYLNNLIDDKVNSNHLVYNLNSLINRKIELENFVKTNEIVEVISVNSSSVYDQPVGFKGKILRVVLLGVLGLIFGFTFLYFKKFYFALRMRK